MSIIFNTDGYKPSHYLQDPPGTTAKFSYIEARKGDFTVSFGLYYILDKYLGKPITQADIEEAAEFYPAYGLPFNREGWQRIVDVHHGYMPVIIKAVPEGHLVPTGNVLVTVESTDPELPWVPSYIETLLLRVWYPMTVATNSFKAKRVIARFMKLSGADMSGLDYKLHDFGARGVSSEESAIIGGMAHLLNFKGSDTVEAIIGVRRLYGGIHAASIPASEHSTITAWGRDREVDAFRNMLQKFAKPGAVLACVSDSYDIYKACSDLWGTQLRQEVIDSGAVVVIRPDSGDATVVVPEILRILADKFGYTETLGTDGMKYKLLNHVRVIQGDGIDSAESIEKILTATLTAGFSADNLAFGMGGGLLQQVNRDNYGFAMKTSAALINGQWVDVYKDPVHGGKTSKKGRLTLIHSKGKFVTVTEAEAAKRGWEDGEVPVLETVYAAGVVRRGESWEKIKARLNQYL